MSNALIAVLVAYVVGSVSGSLLLGRFRKVDIRTMGSGNAGGTNALRTQGLGFALAVVLVDLGKGAAATAWAPMLAAGTPAVLLSDETLRLACGFAAVLGHCYPLFHGFRGGKGAATAVGVLAVLAPALLVPMLLVWLIVLALSGYVGLATVLAGISLVPAAWISGAAPSLFWFCVLLALFIVYTHRANLQRLKAGTENRFERARITHWLRRSGDD
jgi:acyl phosphate:glycerol-3-phosphate acyltransferase